MSDRRSRAKEIVSNVRYYKKFVKEHIGFEEQRICFIKKTYKLGKRLLILIDTLAVSEKINIDDAAFLAVQSKFTNRNVDILDGAWDVVPDELADFFIIPALERIICDDHWLTYFKIGTQ